MDREAAALLYEEGAAETLTIVKDFDILVLEGRLNPAVHRDWLEEQVADQLHNANLCRRSRRRR